MNILSDCFRRYFPKPADLDEKNWTPTGVYRVRKSFFGKPILQEEVSLVVKMTGHPIEQPYIAKVLIWRDADADKHVELGEFLKLLRDPVWEL